MPPDERAFRVAMLGGVPALLGGGGLELQIRHTAAALRRRGHDARPVVEAPAGWDFDVLHVVGHTGDVGHVLHHWRRHPARLVVSPVLVVPQRREWRLLLGTRLPIPAFEPRVLRALVARADHLVALTDWEAAFLRRIGRGGPNLPVTVVGNGVDRPETVVPVRTVDGVDLPEGFVVTVGAVSPRKRQLEIARAARGVAPYVVVGGWDGPDGDREAFRSAVAATGGCWLGEMADLERLLGIVAAARALIHLSDAEGQSLAVLEALAVGTRCVLSDLPQQRELARRWPGYVALVADDQDVPRALRELEAGVASPVPYIPTWDEIAGGLEVVYRAAMGREPRLWADRG